MQNQVKIKLTESKFHELCDQGKLTPDCISEVITDDSFLANDEVYQKLKSVSFKAYKAMQDYKFKKLHNIQL